MPHKQDQNLSAIDVILKAIEYLIIVSEFFSRCSRYLRRQITMQDVHHQKPSTFFTIGVFRHAAELLRAVPELAEHPINANLILPHALKMTSLEPSSSRSPPRDFSHQSPLWLGLWSFTSGVRQLDFVVALTSSNISTLPLFIFTPHPASTLTLDFMSPRLQRLVDEIYNVVDPKRVFAVYSLTGVSRCFASHWSAKTGISISPSSPFYTAVLATVTSKTLVERSSGAQAQSRSFRHAKITDLYEVALQVKEFADDSKIYPMSHDDACREAEGYIRERKLWVCETESSEGVRRIVSIVAVTRNAGTSAFITKVFTPPKYRGNGHAQFLVSKVSDHYLTELAYETVSLYVDEGNKAAAATYTKVGYQGINVFPRPTEVQEWEEVGFDETLTDKGFW